MIDLFPKCLLFEDDEEFADVNEVDFTGMVNDAEVVLLDDPVVVLLLFVRLFVLDDVSAYSSSDF